MKRCLSCLSDFETPDWKCPRCGHSPSIKNGFVAFIPELADAKAGFFPESHDILNLLQEKSFWFRARNRLLQDLAKKYFSDATSVLEIGCGTGYVLSGLGEALPQAKLFGSELDTKAIEYASKRLSGRASFFQMDVRRIPFTSEFDLVAACDVLEHIDDDEAVLAEVFRAVKPGGGVLITVPQHPELWSAADKSACHKRRYRRNELANKASRAGFEILIHTSFVFTLLPAMALHRFWSNGRPHNPTAMLSLPKFLDKSLEMFLNFERWLIAHNISLPAGGSCIIAARRGR